MSSLLTFIVVIQVLSALAIIGLVLMQHGKGADMGAAFGSGASGSLFGASGSSNFLSKSTGVAATIFFVATLALAFMSGQGRESDGGVMQNLPAAGAIPDASENSSANVSDSPAPQANDRASSSKGAAGQANQIPE